MKDKIKVGSVLQCYDPASRYLGDTLEITAIGKNSIIGFHNSSEIESHWTIDCVNFYFTLKKPEPKLKKLVAWVCPEGNIADVDFEDSEHNENWTKKELIVKDGSVYVDMSEMEK